MKKHEDMIGTERMAIKSKNGVKIVIERKTIDNSEQYLIKPSDNVVINDMEIPKGILLFLTKLIFEEGNIYIDAIVLANVGLRTVWVNQNGLLHEFIGSYPIEPEEDVYSGNINLSIYDVEEISIDLEMFSDMMKNELIVGTPSEIGKYGLYYQQIKEVVTERDPNADYLNQKVKYYPKIRIIKGINNK